MPDMDEMREWQDQIRRDERERILHLLSPYGIFDDAGNELSLDEIKALLNP